MKIIFFTDVLCCEKVHQCDSKKIFSLLHTKSLDFKRGSYVKREIQKMYCQNTIFKGKCISILFLTSTEMPKNIS